MKGRRSFLSKVAAGAAALTLAGAHRSVSRAADTEAEERKFVPVMITPFRSDMKIDFDALSRLVDFYLASGVKGFFANCLSSEMYQLEAEERLALARHVVKRVNGAVPVVATGSFGQSIEERATFAKAMYHTGVDAVILITSHFADKEESDAILKQNFEKFFALTDMIPMGTYECPSPYKRILTPEVLRPLLETNRLIYHKDTTLDLEKIRVKLEMARGSRLELYDAHTPNAMASLQMGAKGLSCIAGNFYPEIFAWMCKHTGNPEKQEDMTWLQAALTRADNIISQGYPLSAKYFLQKRGVSLEIISRATKTPLTETQKQNLDGVYKELQGWHERLGIKPAH
ncbi:dihydrodipicolinate synthase family protein [Fulvivirgaceae bacterium PWU4]|uniref:Dihydrodipicolinate synthase family protein n=1 Tax=Chryseosolibacter histidini TaxID=2782349 RepID=A0AAP2GIE7_9BACT|nr:dihydrodipicolinate synthase family protein [Chryseosolibacter histidini]MBT1696984.1 dihydrodipicolinate synthase family protein [Chryseosolibacter histidini]